MATTKPRALIAVAYEDAAQQYLRSLPLEHFMEATAQATQREITLESLALVKARRSDFHVFNELLVQYPRPKERKPGQVVPDNMVVISDKPLEAVSSFNTPLEPAPPFWVLEYVSKSNRRKDYEENFDKYEKELKVPYYLTFYPDNQELSLYRHSGKNYVSVKPNKHGRFPVTELGIEVALLDGWVRFWHQGELLALPGDLQRELDEATRALDQASRHIAHLEQEIEAEKKARAAAEAELAKLRAAAERHPPRRANGSKGDR